MATDVNLVIMEGMGAKGVGEARGILSFCPQRT